MGKIIDQFDTLEELKEKYPPVNKINPRLKYKEGDNFTSLDNSTSLTILYQSAVKKGGKTTWACQCSCGKYTVARNEQLTWTGKNSKRSCGCLKARYGFSQENTNFQPKNIQIGDTFGLLTVLDYEGKNDIHDFLYRCECECGNIVIKTAHELSKTISCGCKKMSANEIFIRKYLEDNNIKYEQEKIFFNKKRFDFYIDNKYIIEYDGEQHFHQIGPWNNLTDTHKKDLEKNKYCFDNNIPLIRIPYDADYDLNDLKLETTRFLLTRENEGEYYEKRI